MKRLMKIKELHQPSGYTIIELLFAVANFTFVMMIAITTFVVVMRIYNKSNFSRTNQQAARNAVYMMENDIKFARVPASVTSTNDLCLVLSDKVVRYRLNSSTIERGEAVSGSPSGSPCSTISTHPIMPEGYVVSTAAPGLFSLTEVTHSGSGREVMVVDINFTSARGTSAAPTDPFHDELTVQTAVIAREGTY